MRGEGSVSMRKPVIAIVGRPNVGKSTLFNRLARKRKAIVEDQPGVTRDRIYAETSWNDHAFILIDTGGFEPTAKDGMAQQIREQAVVAIQEAEVILFLMDGKEGLTPTDIEAAAYLRKISKPVFYAVNKIDGERHEDEVIDFFRLGVEPLFSISAQHGRGVGDLMDEVTKALPPPVPEETRTEEEIRVALVGRPNVGKSSLLNKLIGRPRVMVDSRPGTTRDAIDTPLSWDGKKYVFIDTAGLRRRSRITERLEKYSAVRALKSLERCDVALVLIDGYEGLTEQDARIIEFAVECGRAVLLIVNKWDLVQKDSRTIDGYKKRIYREIKTFDYIPVFFISALTGQRVRRIFAAIQEVVEEYRKRIPTGNLNQWLQETLQALPPPSSRNRPVKIYFLSQVNAAPPTFVFFTNRPEDITESYQRFLLRRLRERYGFSGVPIRFLFRQRKKELP